MKTCSAADVPAGSARPGGLRRTSPALGLDRPRVWREYLAALVVSSVCTAIGFPLSPRVCLTNIVMLYLLGTTLGALRLGRGPSAVLAVANVLAFNFFFVPPLFSFDVDDVQYVFAMIVMLIVAMVIANLMISIRRHRDMADAREQRTAVLYAMSRELAVASNAEEMAAAATRHICSAVQGSAIVLMADPHGRLLPMPPARGSALQEAGLSASKVDLEFAQEVAARAERGERDAIYLPLHGSRLVTGVIVVEPRTANLRLPTEQLHLLDAFAVQLALALERVRLAEIAEAAKISAERASLRNTLLASISHDLRTPLSAIAGAGSLIAQPEYALDVGRLTRLGHVIEHKARDMAQLLTNVLELMRMEFSSGDLETDWHAIDDLVSVALRDREERLTHWRIVLELPAELTLVLVEPTLIVKMLSNLLENIEKYTPSGTTITISAAVRDAGVVLVIADDGPGLPAGDPERLFEKFQRGRTESNIIGVGLGLAICRAAARLHGGDIRAMDNPGGGARFEISLPVPIQVDAPAPAQSCRDLLSTRAPV